MQRKAASLMLGDFGPTLTELYFDGRKWTTQSQDFETDEEAQEAWGKLGLEGYLTANEGYFWVGAEPVSVTVSCDLGAGHLFLTFDEANPQHSAIGFISNPGWVVENGVGFLHKLTKTSQETMEHHENSVVLQ
jgi:hypothetical protein